jgi:Protein of unknown function (DUF2905)
MGRQLGPWLVGIGLLVVIIGGLAWSGLLSWFGRLPGDLRFGSGGTRVFIPITSMVLVSLVLSAVLTLIRRR